MTAGAGAEQDTASSVAEPMGTGVGLGDGLTEGDGPVTGSTEQETPSETG